MNTKLVTLQHFSNVNKIIQKFGDKEDLQNQLMWANEVAHMLNDILHATLNAKCIPPEMKKALQEELLENYVITTHLIAIEQNSSIDIGE